MKLSEWGRQQGIHYQTALRWFHAGTLPIPAYQNPKTYTVVVNPPPDPKEQGVALYARVSSADQKADLERQLARLYGKRAAKNRALRAVEATQ
jgi:predicted site-specific integrase-resolvase